MSAHFKAFDLTVARQKGAFRREQAIAAGYKPSTIDSKVRSGEWRVLHPGVYCLRSMPQNWELEMSAAILWAYPATASCGAAARLHGLPGFEDADVELMTTNRRVSSRCGITVHHTKRLPDEQISVLDGIPATSIERTLLDLCGFAPRRRAAIALDHALHTGLTTIGGLDFCLFLTARRGRNGCGVLREMVKTRASLSEYPNTPLETVIFEMFSESTLPMPQLQLSLYDESGGFIARPDFVYPEQRLVIEGHSRLFHTGHEFEEGDRIRHERLRLSAHEVMYVSWSDATRYRDSTVRTIEKKLIERGWKPWAA